MKTMNYQELVKNAVVETLWTGDIIQGAPSDVEFIKALDRGWVECANGVLKIISIQGISREIIYLADQELDALKEAIEWAKK